MKPQIDFTLINYDNFVKKMIQTHYELINTKEELISFVFEWLDVLESNIDPLILNTIKPIVYGLYGFITGQTYESVIFI